MYCIVLGLFNFDVKFFFPKFVFFQRLDPTQFLRIYGQKCKIHIDPQLSAAGDGKTVMYVQCQPA